ncbi:MAG: GSCFA domain-containing protein [Cytophagaceae bacterium]|jgi:hypothetical protein|nr:GSCFA domain-containing protein [Cytophagaceae bacterium]
MMHWRTELEVPDFAPQYSYKNRYVALGSCFADVVGLRMHDAKMDIQHNPFGNVFNPVSIARMMQAFAQQNPALLIEPVIRKDIFFSYHLHSDTHSRTEEDFTQQVAKQVAALHKYLITTDVLLITLGTAIVHEHIEKNIIVSNCHKVPASHFTMRLLQEVEINHALHQIISHFQLLNPKGKVVFSLSPVRHHRDKLEMNSVSKALLRIGIHKLVEQGKAAYFPSYELLMDDLRDYRFYADDLMHPSIQAEEYVWNKFQESFFNAHTQALMQEWLQLKKAMQHVPMYPESAEYRQFLENTLDRLEKLDGEITLTSEMAELRTRLKDL